LKKKFHGEITEIKQSVEILKTATLQVKNSEKFLKIMEIILNVGNYLNGSKANGQVNGFKLSSLSKLADVKSADNKTNLLDFLVEKIQTKFPDLVSFPNDLTSIKRAFTAVSQIEIEKKNVGSFKEIDYYWDIS